MRILSLDERDIEQIAKGIALGVGIGIILGMILNNVILFFSIGGVFGIVVSSILQLASKLKKRS